MGLNGLSVIFISLEYNLIDRLFLFQFKGLYTLDLIALGLPYLFLIPLHFTVNSMIKHYVLHDDARTSLFFVAYLIEYPNCLMGVYLLSC